MKKISWLIPALITSLAGLGVALKWFLDSDVRSWHMQEPIITIIAIIISSISVIYSFIVARRRKSEGNNE